MSTECRGTAALEAEIKALRSPLIGQQQQIQEVHAILI
jgi:hypothetical protein